MATVCSLKVAESELGVAGSFSHWHLRRKFDVMAELFRRYLTPGNIFLDMACGTGSGLQIADSLGACGELWGMDIDAHALAEARRRVPQAKLQRGDMHDPKNLPAEYFDVVHEFGAAFYSSRWDALARAYFSLLRPGGILLWELPQKWSMAHLSYLLAPAPRLATGDSLFKRLLRSVSPSKYHYESDAAILRILDSTGIPYQVIERATIWHFFCPPLVRYFLDWLSRQTNKPAFDLLDRVARVAWPRSSGYYLVVRKLSA